MNRLGRATIMLCLGGMAGRLLWSGGFGWFVQQRMFIPLLLATIVLVIFGLSESAQSSEEDAGADRRSVGPRVGWLLALPVLVLISVAPTGLGAAAAGRVDAYNPVETDSLYPALDDSSGPVEMRVLDFVNRALWDDSRTLEGTNVQLEGLVVNDPDAPDGFLLTRFVVSCCAADGLPVQVRLRNTEPLEDNTWVVAEVNWREPDIPYAEQDTAAIVEADVISITIDPDPPSDAYESPF